MGGIGSGWAWLRHSGGALRLPALLALAFVAGCATRGPDGLGERPPAGLQRTPDARPRIEPLRSGGPNKPYEVAGQRYVPMTADLPLAETGLASWYGRKFHGLPTASGEPYDMYAMTAAHRTMPIPSYARVRNPANGREVIVRINDRGPFSPGRVIDLSYTAALKLGVLSGVALVEVRRLTSDDIRALERGPAPRVARDDPAPGDNPADAAGWWLQLGAFRLRDAALELQQRALRELPDGTGVAVREADGWFRVQAGPYSTRPQAQDAGGVVQRQLGIAGLLVERAAAH